MNTQYSLRGAEYCDQWTEELSVVEKCTYIGNGEAVSSRIVKIDCTSKYEDASVGSKRHQCGSRKEVY